MLVGAISIVLAHNHPSGTLNPGYQDREITSRMRNAGEIIGIAILDHVIVTDHAFLSLREETMGWEQSRLTKQAPKLSLSRCRPILWPIRRNRAPEVF